MGKNEISCVILSGGKSSRMGQDKALLRMDGKRFVDLIAERFSMENNNMEILLSVRNPEDFPEIALPHIADDYPGCGPLAGIHSALKHARNSWVFVIACDTPFFSQAAFLYLSSHISDQVDAIIPQDVDGRLHVLSGLYHKRMLPNLEKQLEEGNYRVRQVLQTGHTTYVPVEEFEDSEIVFCNINTMDDYKEVVIL